jgi:hypothetical protein
LNGSSNWVICLTEAYGLALLDLQAQLKEWEAAEAQKRALAREIALKLKEDRAAQLADRDLVSFHLSTAQHSTAQHSTAQHSTALLVAQH